MKEDEGTITFGPVEPKVRPLHQSRKTQAISYINRALAQTGPLAIRFQRQLIEDAEASDDVRLKKLGFDAAESILDRLMGKASQEIRVGEAHERPLIFDSKLAALRQGMEKALDVVKANPEANVVDELAREMTKGLVDTGGVII
jgi:hypothetical protein